MNLIKSILVILTFCVASLLALSGCSSDSTQQKETKNPPQVRKNKKDNG